MVCKYINPHALERFLEREKTVPTAAGRTQGLPPGRGSVTADMLRPVVPGGSEEGSPESGDSSPSPSWAQAHCTLGRAWGSGPAWRGATFPGRHEGTGKGGDFVLQLLTPLLAASPVGPPPGLAPAPSTSRPPGRPPEPGDGPDPPGLARVQGGPAGQQLRAPRCLARPLDKAARARCIEPPVAREHVSSKARAERPIPDSWPGAGAELPPRLRLHQQSMPARRSARLMERGTGRPPHAARGSTPGPLPLAFLGGQVAPCLSPHPDLWAQQRVRGAQDQL